MSRIVAIFVMTCWATSSLAGTIEVTPIVLEAQGHYAPSSCQQLGSPDPERPWDVKIVCSADRQLQGARVMFDLGREYDIRGFGNLASFDVAEGGGLEQLWFFRERPSSTGFLQDAVASYEIDVAPSDTKELNLDFPHVSARYVVWSANQGSATFAMSHGDEFRFYAVPEPGVCPWLLLLPGACLRRRVRR